MDNDDVPTLPADTMQILKEFLREKEERERYEEDCMYLKKGEDFEENWQLSQFWYSEDTKKTLAKICQCIITNENDKIGLLSCPSLYLPIKNIHKNVNIFEYDKRFSAYGQDFIHYDINSCNETLKLYYNTFDIVIADPPFLSEECIQKMATIVRMLAKDTSKIIMCSGKIVNEWAQKYISLKMYKYKPKHNRNLGNEFATYANFNFDEFL